MALLEIFVAPGCWSYDTALGVASATMSRDIPGLVVQIIDLTHPNTSVPDNVVAVPTYRLDGVVISLGNPDPDELIEKLIRRSVSI